MTTTLAASGLSSGHLRKRLKMILYGPFGTWKTVTAHHLPNTRTLDLDDGMQSVEWAILAGKLDRKLDEIVYQTLVPKSLDEAKNKIFDRAADKIEQWTGEEDIPPEEWEEYCLKKHSILYPQYWDTLIIDSGTSLTSAAIIVALKEMDRLGLSKSWENRTLRGVTPVMIQDRGALNILFNKFMTLAFSTGKNIVLICHEYVDTDKKGIVRGYLPALSGQLRADVPKNFDEVWYAKIKGAAKDSQAWFQTKADPMRKCKSRLGCLDALEEADFDKIKNKVAKFYKIKADLLWISPKGTKAAKAFVAEEAKELKEA